MLLHLSFVQTVVRHISKKTGNLSGENQSSRKYKTFGSSTEKLANPFLQTSKSRKKRRNKSLTFLTKQNGTLEKGLYVQQVRMNMRTISLAIHTNMQVSRVKQMLSLGGVSHNKGHVGHGCLVWQLIFYQCQQ